MKYIGCQKDSGTCDACGAAQEYRHTLEGFTHLCRACAEAKITPRGDKPMAGIAEAWSRRDGGRWVSRWHVEEMNL